MPRAGFQLAECETSLSTSDFYAEDFYAKVMYYKEMEDLIKRETGARHVRILHHQVSTIL